MRALYEAVDDRRVIGAAVGRTQGPQPIQATVQVEDVSGFLENAASSESKVSIGPLVLPFGTILALFGRLAQGPRVGGGLHVVREDDGVSVTDLLVLTAYFSTPGRLHHWRVSRELSSPEDASRPAVAGLVSELASRMFVDLALESTVSWRAGQKFLDGLKVYRDSLYATADRKLKLRRAERLLIEALAEDERIPFVHYNLGVVYTELRALSTGDAAGDLIERDVYFAAAEQAFLNETRRSPDRWEPYYALAQTHFDQGRYRDVTARCDRIIELRPAPIHVAKAYDLKGLAEANLAPELGAEIAARRARVSRRRALRYAWRALVRAELSRRGVAAARALASRSLQHLATPATEDWALPVGRLRSGLEFRWRHRLLKHAIRLADGESAHLYLAALAAKNGRLGLALEASKKAVRIAPTGAVQWAMLARVDLMYAERARAAGDHELARQWQDLARRACHQALNFVDVRIEAYRPQISMVSSVFEDLGDSDRALRVRQMLELEQRLAAAADPITLDAAVQGLPDVGWEAGLAVLRCGQLGPPAPREGHYRAAIGLLEDEFPEEVRRRGLRSLLARALADAGRFGEAVLEAERAIGLDPASAYEREALGDVYVTMQDYEHAREAFESALLWQPNSVSLHRKLGRCNTSLATWSNDADTRRAYLLAAERHYLSALEVYGPGSLAEKSQIHFALARLYSDLDEFEKVLPHIRNVVAGPATSVLVDMLGAEAFRRQKNHSMGEGMLTRAIETGERLLADEAYGPEFEAGVDSDDPWPLAAVVGWACWLLARSYTDREVRLDEAENLLRRGTENLERSTDYWPSLRAALIAGRGWVAFKRGRLDEAIRLLEEALGIEADPEVYLHLAYAYEAKARRARSDAARARLVDRATRACRRVLDDALGLYGAEAEALLSRLQRADAALVQESVG